MSSIVPREQVSLRKRLRPNTVAPTLWFTFGLTCGGVVLTIWGAFQFASSIPLPWSIVSYVLSTMAALGFAAATREHFIRYGIRIAEESGLLVATPIGADAAPALPPLNDGDIAALRFLAHEAKNSYTLDDFVHASGRSKHRCLHHLENLVKAGFAETGTDQSRHFIFYLTAEGREKLAELGELP